MRLEGGTGEGRSMPEGLAWGKLGSQVERQVCCRVEQSEGWKCSCALGLSPAWEPGFVALWRGSPAARCIWESKKIKSVTVSIVFPSICHELMGLDAMILVF